MGSTDDVGQQSAEITNPEAAAATEQVIDDAGSEITIRDKSDNVTIEPPPVSDNSDSESERPSLPPRPGQLDTVTYSPANTLQIPKKSPRPKLQSQATTAVSYTDIQTQSLAGGKRETYASSVKSTPSAGYSANNTDDSASIRSSAPTLGAGFDAESLLGDAIGDEQPSPAWRTNHAGYEVDPLELLPYDLEEPKADFSREFDELADIDTEGENEEELLEKWRSKRKHFLILSAAGKPIYNRHGSDSLVSGYIGVVQTIISFYESNDDTLKTFTAGGSRFVIMLKGPLYLVAISKLGESETQLRVQLEALYMQILSTLTLPTLTQLFSKRPNSDLRRPLEGTHSLLSALADSFTRGSPSILLSALECLRIRKAHRQTINNTMIKTKCKDLLYGLIVAGGRLVSVIRPRTHSLHPGDLQLIFNMLFEAGGVKAGGGESWIPMCLPGFNKNGYLYMYVSFLPVHTDTDSSEESSTTDSKSEDRIAVLLISANRESFFALRTMRDAMITDLTQNSMLSVIRRAVLAGRPSVTDIVPGTVLRHFLYKSRGNLQYVIPSYEPEYTTVLERRKLASLYHTLHAAIHAKNAHVKVFHGISREHVCLAWVTPVFELYCVAGCHATRSALAQSANKVVQWVRKEEERIFIIGGAVF